MTAFLAVWLLAISSPIPSPNVQTIVRDLEARYHHAATLKAAFLERYKQGGETTQIESGTVYFEHPGKMRWEYESPEKKLFLVDGKNVWFYVPRDRTASRAKLKDSADWRTPFALLTGSMNLNRLCGRVTLAPADQAADTYPVGALDRVLRCFPGDSAEKAGFDEVRLVLNPDNQLEDVVVFQAGGIETDFQFGSWEENLPLPEVLFHFEPPVGVAIVDEQALLGEVH